MSVINFTSTRVAVEWLAVGWRLFLHLPVSQTTMGRHSLSRKQLSRNCKIEVDKFSIRLAASFYYYLHCIRKGVVAQRGGKGEGVKNIIILKSTRTVLVWHYRLIS